VLGKISAHGADDAKFISALRDVRKQVAYLDAALPAFAKLPWAAEDLPDVVKLCCLYLLPKRLPVLGFESWLRIKAVYVGNAAVHEEQNDILHSRLEVGCGLGEQRVQRE
jgi:hypothetical protein